MATSHRVYVPPEDWTDTAVQRAVLALEMHPAWRDLVAALVEDREKLRRQIENLSPDASMEHVRFLAGQMRAYSHVIEKPARLREASKPEARRIA